QWRTNYLANTFAIANNMSAKNWRIPKMKLTFNLADRDQALAGLSISAGEFLELEGITCAIEGEPKAAETMAVSDSFEETMKNLVVALLNADPKEAAVWTEALTKQVGSCIARRAFERLRDNNANALAAWAWKERIEWELPGAKLGSLSSDLM